VCGPTGLSSPASWARPTRGAQIGWAAEMAASSPAGTQSARCGRRLPPRGKPKGSPQNNKWSKGSTSGPEVVGGGRACLAFFAASPCLWERQKRSFKTNRPGELWGQKTGAPSSLRLGLRSPEEGSCFLAADSICSPPLHLRESWQGFSQPPRHRGNKRKPKGQEWPAYSPK